MEIGISELAIALFGVINALFWYITNQQNKRISNAEDKIDKNSLKDEEDNKTLRAEMVALLEKHYVTTGQLATLDEKMMGEIRVLSVSVNRLSDLLERFFPYENSDRRVP